MLTDARAADTVLSYFCTSFVIDFWGKMWYNIYTDEREVHTMSKILEEMRKAEQHITNACGCHNECANCVLQIRGCDCILTMLQRAISNQSIRDLRAEAGEVM